MAQQKKVSFKKQGALHLTPIDKRETFELLKNLAHFNIVPGVGMVSIVDKTVPTIVLLWQWLAQFRIKMSQQISGITHRLKEKRMMVKIFFFNAICIHIESV